MYKIQHYVYTYYAIQHLKYRMNMLFNKKNNFNNKYYIKKSHRVLGHSINKLPNKIFHFITPLIVTYVLISCYRS